MVIPTALARCMVSLNVPYKRHKGLNRECQITVRLGREVTINLVDITKKGMLVLLLAATSRGNLLLA